MSESARPASRRRPEVLAPAGDWDTLRAAVSHGADAVYFGIPSFNARYRAKNFEASELPEVFAYLRKHNVRGYVAFNTLVFSDELPDAVQALAAAAQAGADAFIVQDLGVAKLLKSAAPNVAVHGSTQMTLTEPRGIEFVKRLGVERVILARELTIDEIKAVSEKTAMELEVFVHGALCVAYSGQCLTSEALGGRSANRGQCAQACRMPYALVVDGRIRDLGDRAYLLSPQDLAAHSLVGDLLKAGVSSLKIEGRLKAPPYVAATTQTYRAAVEAALRDEAFTPGRQEQLDLEQSFSRGLSLGFLGGLNHQTLVPARFPKSRGVRVGEVTGLTKRGVVVRLDERHPDSDFLQPGDGVVFDLARPEEQEPGGRIFAVNVARDPRLVELEFGRGKLDYQALDPGTVVWRTDDPTLARRLNATASDDAINRERLDLQVTGSIGQPLTVSARTAAGDEATVRWPGPLELARKHPLDEALIRSQLGRLGDSPFELGDVTTDLPDAVMAPKSVLNELRRELVAGLIQARDRRACAKPFDRQTLSRLRAEAASQRVQPSAALSASENPDAPRLNILVRSLEQLDAVLAWRAQNPPTAPDLIYCDFEDVRRYRDAVAAARRANAAIGLATIRVLKTHEDGLMRQIAKCEPDAVLIRNLGALDFFRDEHPHLRRIGDFSLNVANELTAQILHDAGLERLTPSYDLHWDQLAAMLSRTDASGWEVVLHQHMPMFHMEHCVFAATLSTGKDYRDCGRPCDVHKVELRDHLGSAFPLIPDVGCRNTVFNSAAQSGAEWAPRMIALGVRHFRVELLRHSADEVAPLLDRYARVLAGIEDGRAAWKQLQVVSQLGVTRGTLQVLT